MKILGIIIQLASIIHSKQLEFSSDFKFGVATSAYQVEGAWNTSNKGINIWDLFTRLPDKIRDDSNGDIAADSYHKVEDDVKLLKELGVHFYRFSMSWSRLFPEGFSYKINQDGVNYYNNLINALLAANIEPYVTLYHWDLPQNLQEIGGWTNALLIDYFIDYVRFAFGQFGDRVKVWITFNEPIAFCVDSYEYGKMAPGYYLQGIAGYICTHNVLKAHGQVYKMYGDEFKSQQQGKIGLAIDARWVEPLSNSPEDIEATQRTLDLVFGMYAHPIYTKLGNYPESLIKRVAKLSKEEGFPKSRLPTFTQPEIEMIRGSYDFFALNHYTMRLSSENTQDVFPRPSNTADMNVTLSVKDNWEQTAAPWIFVVPHALRKQLNYIKDEFDNPEIIITENGYPDLGDVHDCKRISYINQYLQQVLLAINEDGVNVTGYTVWSFLDAFEWDNGYSLQFGLYKVNFSDPQRTRTAKMSSRVYKNIIATKQIDWSYNPTEFPACQW